MFVVKMRLRHLKGTVACCAVEKFNFFITEYCHMNHPPFILTEYQLKLNNIFLFFVNTAKY